MTTSDQIERIIANLAAPIQCEPLEENVATGLALMLDEPARLTDFRAALVATQDRIAQSAAVVANALTEVDARLGG